MANTDHAGFSLGRVTRQLGHPMFLRTVSVVPTVLVVVCAALASAFPYAQVSGITFEEVDRKFSVRSSLTELQKDREWEDYEEKCVEWIGEIAYVDERFFGGYVVGFKHRRDTLTYDVLVTVPRSMERHMLSLHQGQRYTYRATLQRYGGAILPVSAEWGCES